jgi:ABC-type sugar transport system permease subunit
MKIQRHHLQRIIFGYCLIAPAFIILLAFFVWPFIQGVIISFRGGFGLDGEFVGFKNYVMTFTDPRFWNSLKVSIIFTVVFILLSGGSALLLANALVKKPRFYGLYLSALFIPYISTPVIGALIWSNILSDPFGIINTALVELGFANIPWLKDTTLALLCLILVQVWYTVGYNTLLFMAGLQAIPTMYFEAAELDGCNFWQKLRYILLPLLIPTIVFVTTISILYGFINSYVLASLITGGGPLEATNVMMSYIFELAFDRFELGRANAVTLILFGLFVGLSFIQVNFQRRKFSGLH